MLLGEKFNALRWIRSHRQQTNHRGPTVTFLPDLLDVQDHPLGVPLPKGVLDVLSRHREGAFRKPAANEQQTTEKVEGVVVAVWNDLVFRSVLVEPRLPLLLVATDLFDPDQASLLISLLILIITVVTMYFLIDAI